MLRGVFISPLRARLAWSAFWKTSKAAVLFEFSEHSIGSERAPFFPLFCPIQFGVVNRQDHQNSKPKRIHHIIGTTPIKVQYLISILF